MNPNNPPLIGIAGLGLLGASIASALKTQNFNCQIIGISSQQTHDKARASNLFNHLFTYDQIDEWKSKVDLLFICLPLDHIVEFMTQIAASSQPFKQGAIITDVGSAKEKIQQQGMRLFDTPTSCFVGGHPMAGSQKSGFDAHSPLLYESALWILTRPEAMVKSKAPLLIKVIETLGSTLVFQEVSDHDRRLARVSHLPQIIATLLAATQRRDPEAIFFSGPGFRDMTRLAESSWPMWEGILNQNKSQILEALSDFQIDLLKLMNDLQHQPQGIESVFREGAEMRAKLPMRSKSQLDSHVGVLVTIPNEPGKIGAVVAPLAAEGINIVDIELLKNREGLGGTLRLSFLGMDEAEKAVSLLSALQISARVY